ncbi:MAG: hypothetical protein IPJ77_07085 [Planctomycetes bacterium]|nr:hypothetical protein [Planctomycetota bacterium]
MERRDEDDPKLPRGLEDGLGGLFGPSAAEQAELDQRIGRAARTRFARRQKVAPARPSVRRVWALRAAAAVLVAFGGWMLARVLAPAPRPHEVARLDLDGNGRVDVLDAFQVARGVARGATKPEWDVDGDGRVDRNDADAVAREAVRTGS